MPHPVGDPGVVHGAGSGAGVAAIGDRPIVTGRALPTGAAWLYARGSAVRTVFASAEGSRPGDGPHGGPYDARPPDCPAPCIAIFLVLAVTDGSLLVASFVLGLLASGEPRGPHAIWHGVHFLFALLTTMATLAVHSIVYTYFLATGKWAKEVVRVYELPDWINAQAKKNKRKAFRFEFWSMTLIAVAAWLGAAADTQGLNPLWHLGVGGAGPGVQPRGVRRRVRGDRGAGPAAAGGQGRRPTASARPGTAAEAGRPPTRRIARRGRTAADVAAGGRRLDRAGGPARVHAS